MKYDFECLICGEEFTRVQEMNARHIAFHCGIEARRVWGCNTHKDQQYSFTTDAFGKPEVVNSKEGWRRLLKKNNSPDASAKEVRQEADFRKRINQEGYALQRKNLAKNIFEKKRDLLKFRIRR